MSSVHDNGRVGEQSQTDASGTDLRDLIDQAGAVMAALVALVEQVDRAGCHEDVVALPTFNTLLHAASDLRDARWYARRALWSLRELV